MEMGRDAGNERCLQMERNRFSMAAIDSYKRPERQGANQAKKKWEQDIVHFLSQALPGKTNTWQQLALDEERWRNRLEHFVKYTGSGI